MDFPHAVRPNYPSACTKGKNAVLSQLLLRWICLPLGKVFAPSPFALAMSLERQCMFIGEKEDESDKNWRMSPKGLESET